MVPESPYECVSFINGVSPAPLCLSFKSLQYDLASDEVLWFFPGQGPWSRLGRFFLVSEVVPANDSQLPHPQMGPVCQTLLPVTRWGSAHTRAKTAQWEGSECREVPGRSAWGAWGAVGAAEFLPYQACSRPLLLCAASILGAHDSPFRSGSPPVHRLGVRLGRVVADAAPTAGGRWHFRNTAHQ